MENLLKDEMRKRLLVYAVQRAIGCPACGGILDARSSVYFELKGTNATHLLCAKCYDARPQHADEVDAETIDGRNHWIAPKPRVRKATKPRLSMKDVKAGDVYVVKVSGRLVPVRIKATRDRYVGRRMTLVLIGESVVSGRLVTVRGVARLRERIGGPETNSFAVVDGVWRGSVRADFDGGAK